MWNCTHFRHPTDEQLRHVDIYFLATKIICSLSTLNVSITACPARAPKKCTQSGNFQFDIKSPSDFKIPSARKLKTLFQKYKLQLTPGIHACLGHVLRKYIYRGFLKDTTTADSHENVEWKSEFISSRHHVISSIFFLTKR